MAAAVLAGGGAIAAATSSGAGVAVADPELTPLLGAPDPAGPAARGVWLRDPKGQVERIAASGHLVAWTVRTPPDVMQAGNTGRPVKRPAKTIVAVADERGGPVLKLGLARRYVRGLRLVRGSTLAIPDDFTSTAPRLAVRSCTSRKDASCRDEVLILSESGPLEIVGSEGPAKVPAVIAGRVDLRRSLDVARRQDRPRSKRCLPRLALTDLASGKQRRLPALPTVTDYNRCLGLASLQLHGRYAFATVKREDTHFDLYAEFFYALDLESGSGARWREVQRPLRISAGSAGIELGPAITQTALWFEELDADDGSTSTLNRVELPSLSQTDDYADAVAPGAANGCDLVATDDAIYELANPRCAAYPVADITLGGEIRRLSGVLPRRAAG